MCGQGTPFVRRQIHIARRLPHQFPIVSGMTPPQDVPLSGVGQFHRSIDPRGVEQAVAGSGTRRIGRRQRFHQQTCNGVEDFLLADVRIPGNPLRAFEREAGDKYGQSPQHRPLDVRQ